MMVAKESPIVVLFKTDKCFQDDDISLDIQLENDDIRDGQGRFIFSLKEVYCHLFELVFYVKEVL